MKNDNCIVLSIDDYENESEFWRGVSEITNNLLKGKYEVLIRYQDVGVYTISFAYDPFHTPDYGCDRFMLVSPDEEESIEIAREPDEEEE